MDSEVNALMKILGFVNPQMSDLKMKIITSQYRRMSLIKYPDKGGRKEDSFKGFPSIIYSICHRIGHQFLSMTFKNLS